MFAPLKMVNREDAHQLCAHLDKRSIVYLTKQRTALSPSTNPGSQDFLTGGAKVDNDAGKQKRIFEERKNRPIPGVFFEQIVFVNNCM